MVNTTVLDLMFGFVKYLKLNFKKKSIILTRRRVKVVSAVDCTGTRKFVRQERIEF